MTKRLFLVAGLALVWSNMGARAEAQDLNLEEVFRCLGEAVAPDQCVAARDVILNNCTTCHTFVPIVMQSFDDNAWRGLLTRHVENGRVDQLSTDEVANLQAYLAENFDGTLPPPELPPALLETWTSY